MTDFSRKPILGEYVVLLENKDQKQEITDKLKNFNVMELNEMPGALIVTTRTFDENEDETFGRLLSIVANEGMVVNQMEDASGNRLIPTGKIIIKLKEEKSRARLNSWLSDYNIDLEAKSKWLPNTLTVQTKSDGQNYNELLEKLRADRDVELADPEVLSKYSRKLFAQ